MAHTTRRPGRLTRRELGVGAAVAIAGGAVLSARQTAAAQSARTLRLGHMWPPSSVWGKGAQRFADLVGERTKGGCTVRVYPNGQLGTERENEEGLGLGNLDCSFGGSDVLSQFEPKMALFALPFLYPSYSVANDVMDGPTGQAVFNALRERAGIRVIGSGAQGFRYILSRRPIGNLSDLKGMKIRVPQSDIMLQMFRMLGANPVAIPWNQTYMSEKTGVIAALEGVPEVLIDFKMYETAKYIANTRHVLATLQLLISDKVYQGLPSATQKIILASGKQAWGEARAAAEIGNRKALEQLKALGEQFTDPDLKPFRQAVQPLWWKWANSTDSVALVKAVIATVKAKA